MAINFPDAPTEGDIYSVGDKSWQWNGTYWEVQPTPAQTFSVTDTAPESPEAGDIWFRTDTSQTLIRYDNTWVEIGHSANIANYIADTDADTKIQVEETSDEDTIRFDVAGSEKVKIESDSITLYDSTTIGASLSVSGDITTGGASVATTGKAIAMAMVFGG